MLYTLRHFHCASQIWWNSRKKLQFSHMNYCKMQTWNTPINASHYSITFITECHYASIIQRSCVNVPDSMPVVPGITHISLQSSFLCSIELNFFSWNRQLNGAPQWTRYKFCAKWMFDQCFMPNVRAEQTFVLPASITQHCSQVSQDQIFKCEETTERNLTCSFF